MKTIKLLVVLNTLLLTLQLHAQNTGAQSVECSKYGVLGSVTSYFCALEKAKEKCHYWISDLDILESNTTYSPVYDQNGLEISRHKTEITFICE